MTVERTLTLPDTMTFTIRGTPEVFRTADLPDATLVAMTCYGRRMANDYANSKVNGSHELSEDDVRQDTIGRLSNGWEASKGGGGRRLATWVKEARSLLQSAGVKPESAKEVKDWDTLVAKVGTKAKATKVYNKAVERAEDSLDLNIEV